MALNADMLSPLMIAAALAGAAAAAVRALKARVVPVVMVVTRTGRVLEMPANDPRIAPYL